MRVLCKAGGVVGVVGVLREPVLRTSVSRIFGILNISRANVATVWLALIGATGAPVAIAADDGRLYNVGVDVASRSLEDRRLGAAAALQVMLTRLSGLTDLPESEALRAAAARPERYYSQYRYFNTSRYDELGQPLTELNLQFSPPAMRSLMLEARLPLWTLNRPRLAVWLTERFGAGNDVIEDPSHPLLAAVLERAQYRGMPTVTPGLMGLNASALWNLDQAALQEAARQQGAEFVLVGRAEQRGPDDWQVDWTSWGGDAQQIRLGGSLEAASAPAVDALVNSLVNEYTVAGGEAGTLELIVENVSAVEDYAQVLQYLSTRSYVENVNVAGLIGDELSVLVTTTGSAEKFMQLLAIDSRLIASTRDQLPLAQMSRGQNPKALPDPAIAPVFGGSIDGGSIDGSSIDSADQPEYGARSAVSVPLIADVRLRLAWQG